MPTVVRALFATIGLAAGLLNFSGPLAHGQEFITPGVPQGEVVVPQAGPDGVVYLNDASLYGTMDIPMGVPHPGAYPMDGDFGGYGPMYCPPPCPPVVLPPQPVCNNQLEQARVYGVFLLLHPVGGDMHFAQQQNGTGGAGTTPFGEIGVADPNYDIGVRVGGLWALDAYTGVGVSYTFFESDAMGEIDAPGIALGTVGSLVHHPGAAVTSSAGPVRGDYAIDFQTAEIDTRHLMVATCNRWVYGTLGARWADLSQEFRTNGIYAGSQGGNILTESDLDFQGAGLRMGLDGEQLIGQSRLSIYGNAYASSLVGEMTGRYRMRNATTVTDLAIARWTDDRIVPMLEYELGLAWTNCSGCFRVSVGYTMIHWFNVATTPVFVDAVQADNYVDLGDTLSFSGLTSRVEWRY